MKLLLSEYFANGVVRRVYEQDAGFLGYALFELGEIYGPLVGLGGVDLGGLEAGLDLGFGLFVVWFEWNSYSFASSHLYLRSITVISGIKKYSLISRIHQPHKTTKQSL